MSAIGPMRKPIPGALGAEIGLLHHRPIVGEQRRIFLLHVGEARERVGLVLLRADLHDIFGRAGGGGAARGGLLTAGLAAGFGLGAGAGGACRAATSCGALRRRGWRAPRAAAARSRQQQRCEPLRRGGSLGRQLGTEASAIEPSGRTTMVFTLRGPPSAMESSAEATAIGSAPPTACVVGVARSVVATGVGMPAALGRRRQRRHRDVLLTRHEPLGLRLVAILQPVVDQLVFVGKFLAARLHREAP